MQQSNEAVEEEKEQKIRDLEPGESFFELSLPSFKEAPNRRPRHKRARPPKRKGKLARAASRRNAYQDYDPRAAEQTRSSQSPAQSSNPNIFPIPVEFLNQIQGGPGKFRPNEFEFQPSAQIEELGSVDSAENHIDQSFSFQPEEGIQARPSQFTLEEGVDTVSPGPTVRSLPPVLGTPVPTHAIYREEYPPPPPPGPPGLHTPYPQVPYHDARHTTPHSPLSVSKEKVLHYMAPPNQVTPAPTCTCLQWES